MADDHIKSEIAAYLAGGLTEVRNRQVEEHLAACEKCHQAMNKARAKQAHQNREALKKAASDRMPNLFLARQGKETGVDRPSSKLPFWLGGALLLAGGTYLVLTHHGGTSSSASVTAEAPVEEAVQASTATPTVPVPVVEKEVPPPPPPAPKAPVLQIKQEWKGADSAIKSPLLMVVRNNDTWEKLWSEMGQTAPLPAVKFGQGVVVGVFAGEQPAGTSVSLGKLRENDEDIAVPYRVQRSDTGISSMTLPTHPYLLSVVSRTDKKIRITQWEAPE